MNKKNNKTLKKNNKIEKGNEKTEHGNSNENTLLLFDWDDCISQIDMYAIFLRGSDNNKFYKNKSDKEKKIEKCKKKIQDKLDLGNKHPLTKWCSVNNVKKDPESIREALGLTTQKLVPKYDKKYVSFVRYCLLPNIHIIRSLEQLLKDKFKILILTNGRIYGFIRCLFYHKFPNTEDGKYIKNFLKLFDYHIHGDSCIQICARPTLYEYVTYRCIFRYDSSIKVKDKGLREFHKIKNREFKTDEKDRYTKLTASFDSDISEDKSIFILKDLIKSDLYKNYDKILYFDDTVWLPDKSENKQVKKYSYWYDKKLKGKNFKYISSKLNDPKLVIFYVPEKNIGLSIMKSKKRLIDLIYKTIDYIKLK